MPPLKAHPTPTIAWISALPIEAKLATAILESPYSSSTGPYTHGRIHDHNVVIGCLPAGQLGTASAAAVALNLKRDFPSIRFGLMVGIGGGVPGPAADVRLGDVVVSQPSGRYGGVVQHDFGTALAGGLQPMGSLSAPPTELLQAVVRLRANEKEALQRMRAQLAALAVTTPEADRACAGPDILYEPWYDHVEGPNCGQCWEGATVPRPRRCEGEETVIHYGTIASGNQLIMDARKRDEVSSDLGGVLCFEMEAAGLMTSFPCLVVRGICDYADSHKNKTWQPFAAVVAAACAKEILSFVPASDSKASQSSVESADAFADTQGHIYSGKVYSGGGQVFQGNMTSANDINMKFGSR